MSPFWSSKSPVYTIIFCMTSAFIQSFTFCNAFVKVGL